jgi:hypothetical protein
MMAAVRMRLAVEEHGAGTQLVRLRSWPRYSSIGVALTVVFAALGIGAALDGAPIAAAILGASALFLGASAIRDCAAATGMLLDAIREPETEEHPVPAPEEELAAATAALPAAESVAYESDNGRESARPVHSRARVARFSEPE